MKYNIIKLNSARNCLRYVIRAFGIKEIYIPYYICPVIRNSAYKEGCKINYYHIDEKFYPVSYFPIDAYILYPNYFGICFDIVTELSSKYKNLIVDNSHSFFSKSSGIASFNSIRKFFPKIRNGAFLYTQKLLDCQLEKDFITYEYKELTDEESLKNEYLIDYQDISFISDTSKEYFQHLDLTIEKSLIRTNFDNYSKRYSSINDLQINLNDSDAPYKYPLLIKDNGLLNDVLIELAHKDIYPLRLWHSLPFSYPEKIFFTNLLVI